MGKQCQTLFYGALKSLQMVTAAIEARVGGGDVGPASSLLFSEGGGSKCWVM